LSDQCSDEVLCPACGSSFHLYDTRSTSTTSAMQQLGKFQLLQRVGVGAFGAVWKARDTELDRIVALKISHAGLLAMPADRERFQREARAAAQLRHPNIVTVHEVATLNGLPALVSDFVEGVPLRDLLQVRRLTFRESAALTADLAEALDYAHHMGVVHRDVKPANVLLECGQPGGAEAEGVGRPLLADFGLALREEAEVTLTVEGEVLGTPAYMSPEQAAGKGHRVDGRSDVFSLGVVLYELLTGELPFRGSKMMILHQVLHEEPRPPRRLNDRVPRDLETICLKALAKDPARRYLTARALADDLRRFLKGEPIQARPAGRVEKLGRWCRRNPLVAGLAAAVCLLLLATLTATTIGYWNVSLARRQAEQQRDLALSREREADELRGQAEAKERQTRDSLRQSLLHQAEAQRQSTRAGRRWLALDALRQAADVRPGLDLRNEYLRGLDLPDLRRARELTLPAEATAGKRYDWFGSQSFAAFRGIQDRILVVPLGGFPVEFDARTGKAHGPFEDVGPCWNPAALSPDGRFFATQNAKRKGAQVWDLDNRKLLGELKDTTGKPLTPVCLAFSDGSNLLAAAAYRSEDDFFRDRSALIFLYDLDSLRLLGSWEAGGRYLDCLRFGPEGKVLAGALVSADMVDSIRLWSVPDGKEEATLPLQRLSQTGGGVHRPRRIDFSRDGRFLLAAGKKGTIKVWDLTPRKEFRDGQRVSTPPQEKLSFAGHLDEAVVALFSPDGRWLATGGADGRLNVWDAHSGLLVAQERLHPESWYTPTHLQWSPSGSLLLCDTPEGLRLWEFAGPASRAFYGRNLWDEQTRFRDSFLLAFSPRERWLAYSEAQSNSVPLIDLRDPDRPQPRLEGSGAGETLAFSPSEEVVWTTWSRGDRTTLWQLPSPKAMSSKGDDGLRSLTVAFNPRGNRIACEEEGVLDLRVIDGETGQALWTRSERGRHTGNAPAVLFSPDGKKVAVSAIQFLGKPIKVWESETGRLTLEGTGGLNDPGLFYRGQRLLAVLDRETLALQDLRLLLRLAAGDVAGYRAACARFVEHFAGDANAANSAAWKGVLVSDAVVDPERLVQLAQIAVASDPRSWAYLNTLGAALYRAGRFQEAVKKLSDAMEVRNKEGNAWDWLFLAMAHHRLGHAREAREWLNKAVSWINAANQGKAQLYTGAPLSLEQRLELLLLHREAERFVNGKAESSPK
jgi:WD40 repeat protein/tRNA A-37 threonylcarbamoyl transferase component Bud32